MNKWEKAQLDRWKPMYQHSWGYRVFNKYDAEMNRLLVSNLYAKSYTFSHLKSDGAKWESKLNDYLPNIAHNASITVEEWSNGYNEFMNWMRMSFLMSICSYFENYLTCIIKECIESDPGLVFGCPHTIDGILLKKKKIQIKKEEIIQKILSCTKGDWNSRLSGLQALFGTLPPAINDSISDLEKIRNLRNDFGHAFGRDIEKAQSYDMVDIFPMQRLNIGKFQKYRIIICKFVQQLDSFLMNNHIGNFEPLLYYHDLYDSIKDKGKGDRMLALKKGLGGEVNTLITKDQCRAIIKYYESL